MREYIELRAHFQKNMLKMSRDELKDLINLCDQGVESSLFRDEAEDYKELAEDIENEIDRRDHAEIEAFEIKHQEEVSAITEEEFSIDKDISLPSSNKIAVTIMDYECCNLFEEVEKELIGQCLNYFKGKRTHTAKAMGISIRTLRNKLNGYKKETEVDDMLLGFYERNN